MGEEEGEPVTTEGGSLAAHVSLVEVISPSPPSLEEPVGLHIIVAVSPLLPSLEIHVHVIVVFHTHAIYTHTHTQSGVLISGEGI